MNIGLVLSGGMAKGAYQIGALKALSHFVPAREIRYISCASVGVINGYAYMTDNLDRVEQMWKDICNDDARLIISQILRSTMLQRYIETLYDEGKVLSSSFYCSLLDLGHRNVVYKDLSMIEHSLVPLYLKASVAMPIYNKAVRIGNEAYYDGAVVDNIPVYPLMKHNLDYVICIYFDDICYRFENTYFDNKIIKLTFPGGNLLESSVVFKQDSIEEMIQSGYERTMRRLKVLFAEGYEDFEYIYRIISCLAGSENSRLRITGDVLVTNLNKITQKLTKRKIL